MKPGDLYGPEYGPTTKTGPGKGDSPRNNRSDQYRNNYDSINWGPKKKKKRRSVCHCDRQTVRGCPECDT